MASINYPATSKRIASLRLHGGRTGSRRSEHEESIPLDLDRDPNDNLKEILINICAQQSVSTGRKLGHLNNLVKLLCSISDVSVIQIPVEVIMTCLKATIVSDVKEVRAAGIRVLRYLVNDVKTKNIFMELNLDYLVTRCLDISHFNEVERIQAVRLIRKLAHLKQKRAHDSREPIVPLSLVACVVSVSLGGAEERDRVYRTCLAVLCELALLQPWLVVRCNGALVLINAVLECHMYQRINECLCLSLMHIINHPSLGEWQDSDLNVSPTFAPYTEINYRLHPDVEDSKLDEELGMRFAASQMAIVSLLRTWTGLLHIFHAKDMIKSFVQSLLIPNSTIRRGILAVLCELFYFNELIWEDNFEKALNAAAPGHFKDNWRIAEGFVVAEAKEVLPVRSVSRPDLVDCHLAIMLSYFLQAGLLEVLTRVALSTEDLHAQVSATIILGSTLHLASRLLPNENMSQWHLPDLLKNTSTETTIEESLHINVVVKNLEKVHMMRSRPPKPHSLYLSQLVSQAPNDYYSFRKSSLPFGAANTRSRSSTANSSEGASTASFAILRRNRSLNLIRDFAEDHTLIAIKSTKVLASKDNKDWDWDALQSLLTSPVHLLRAVGGDDTVRRFYRRLIYFYLPTSKLFSALSLCKEGESDENRKYVLTACFMVRCLCFSDDEGRRLLKNLITDIVDALPKVETSGYSKAAGVLAITCSREYFLILGTLSCHPRGDELLGHCRAYHYFMGLASEQSHETIVRLMVSSLHYSEDSPARAVLSKVLTTCNDPSRLYATGFLRVLLRSNCPGFQRWGTELLTTQLFDKSNDVAAEALDILHEACDDRDYLRAVVRLRPTLLHLGERGAILVCRFLSEPQGFAYLTHNHYLDRELERWWTVYNERYVLHVEELLKLSLTSYEKTSKEDGFVRRTGNKKSRQAVYLPAHLYGELCRHERGAKLVEEQNIAPLLTDKLKRLIGESQNRSSALKKQGLKEECAASRVLKIKSCVWALSHIGSTYYGLPLLERCNTLPIITKLASQSASSSVRGTCVYGLCAVSQTIPGVEALKNLGYDSVLFMVNKCTFEEEHNLTPPEPIVTPRLTRSELLSKSISSSLQWSTASGSPQPSSKFSPESTSNLSASSESTRSFVSGTKSRRGSKMRVSKKGANSEHGSSFSLKRRGVVKPSSTNDETYLSSPDALSSSTISQHSTFLDTDTTSYGSYHQDTKSPTLNSNEDSIKRHPNSNHVRAKSYTGSFLSTFDRRQADKSESSSFYTPTKNRLKNRLIDLFSKKNRSKSHSGTAVHGNNTRRKTQQDDTSSGYVSDQLAVHDPILFEQRNRNPGSPESDVVNGTEDDKRSPVLDSTTLTSSSNASVDTLKIERVNTSDAFNEERTSEVLNPDKEVGLPLPNLSTKASIHSMQNVAAYNTNNSGQATSTVSDQTLNRTQRSRTQFFVSSTVTNQEEPKSPKKLVKRTQSLPDVLDKSEVEGLTKLKSQRLASLQAKLHFVSISQSASDVTSSEEQYQSYSNHNSASVPKTSPHNCITIKHTDDKANYHDEDGTLTRTTVAISIQEFEAAPNLKAVTPYATSNGGLGDNDKLYPCRERGNTQVSQDSGVVLTSNSPTASKQSTQFCDENITETSMTHVDGNEWTIAKPLGLAAVRMFEQRYLEGKSGPGREMEFLSLEDKADILKTTRYIGITIPTVLSDLFKSSTESINRKKSSLNPSIYLRDGFLSGAISDANAVPRERKVSTVRQPAKFRGLDESNLATGVSSGLKYHKPYKMQSVVTPFARTPDSLLFDVGDVYYVGGHVVEPGSEEFVALLHDEITQLIINLASSVGVKAHETSLLMMKEKKPEVFDSISLYNNIVRIMSEYCFRLTTRRFIQELFQDVRFTEVYREAQRALQTIE
ncbi:rapamycin-insensitive companion of mTOR-like isoform X2 [Clavelina lepadiformis]|uniref:rapamycin-insensitive companion of mTOR-like isoform X2 n=1 Tax=Clavelina lepadiformis TaxID=159417 RepID=UPI0040429525